MNEVELKSQSVSIVEQSTELVVFDSNDNNDANNLLKSVKSAQKLVNEFFKPMVDAAFKSHKEITSKRKTFLDPLSSAEKAIKDKISGYLTEQRKERDRVERELRELAEKKEKERLAKVAKEEEELRKAADHLTPEEVAIEQKRIEEDNAKRFMPEVKVDKEEAPQGQVAKESWFVASVDKETLPKEYFVIDMDRLDQIAKSEKGKASVPGVKFDFRLRAETRR